MMYGHGDDAFRYGDKIKMNFSSNVYSGADYSGLKKHLMAHFDVIGHYPEPDAHTLESMLAEKLGVPENTILVTNGANEAIYLIANLYSGWASVIPQPTFTEYEDACRKFRHLISYDSADELEVLPEDRIYWLCNPNNPTGTAFDLATIEYIAENVNTNIRDLEGELSTILLMSEVRNLTPLELIQNGSVNVNKTTKLRPTSPKQIVEKVAKYYDLTPTELKSKSRVSHIMLARQVAMLLLSKELGLSTTKIATEVGVKDHTTVMHGIKKINNSLKLNFTLRDQIEEIKEKIYG